MILERASACLSSLEDKTYGCSIFVLGVFSPYLRLRLGTFKLNLPSADSDSSTLSIFAFPICRKTMRSMQFFTVCIASGHAWMKSWLGSLIKQYEFLHSVDLATMLASVLFMYVCGGGGRREVECMGNRFELHPQQLRTIALLTLRPTITHRCAHTL